MVWSVTEISSFGFSPASPLCSAFLSPPFSSLSCATAYEGERNKHANAATNIPSWDSFFILLSWKTCESTLAATDSSRERRLTKGRLCVSQFEGQTPRGRLEQHCRTIAHDIACASLQKQFVTLRGLKRHNSGASRFARADSGRRIFHDDATAWRKRKCARAFH